MGQPHHAAGDELGKGDLGGCGRRDQQLVEGARLALAGDGQARHHQPQHEAQHADEVGQEEPLELEIGVEPAALPDVQAAAARQRGLPPQRCLRGHLGQHDLHIVGRDLGRVGTPAVQQQLHGHGLATGGPAGELRIEDHDEQGFFLLDGRAHLLLPAQEEHMPEGGRALQTAHDLPAQGAFVMVEHGHVHIAHFHGGGPAEHDDLHERRHDEQHAYEDEEFPMFTDHEQLLLIPVMCISR